MMTVSNDSVITGMLKSILYNKIYCNVAALVVSNSIMSEKFRGKCEILVAKFFCLFTLKAHNITKNNDQ